MGKKILIGLLVAFVIIQFIRPARTVPPESNPNDIALHYTVPAEVQGILKKSCYDCHSNLTEYPFYANVQPIGWWMQSHINEAREELNFSEFGNYAEKKAKHKFEEIEEVAKDGSMPLLSYTLGHAGTKLTPEKSKAVAEWAAALK